MQWWYFEHEEALPEVSSGQIILPTDQNSLCFKPAGCKSRRLDKGLSDVAKLVYLDNFSVNSVVKSQTLHSWYKKLEFDPVTRYSLNKALDDNYQKLHYNISQFIAKRDKMQPMAISYDKWSSADGKKYIGVYLYVNDRNINLGLIPYQGFCGGEEIAKHIKNLLQNFNIVPSDITMAVIDCGADVQSASNVLNWFTFPCLAHIVNLIAKKLMLTDDNAENLTSERDPDEDDQPIELEDRAFKETVRVARTLVRNVNASPKLGDNLEALQRAMEKPVLVPIQDNSTRWNSLYNMLSRFYELREVFIIMYPEELDFYDWENLKRLLGVLKPLQSASVLLQHTTANHATAKPVIKYLRHIASTEPLLNSPVKDTLEKWIDDNDIVKAIFNPYGDDNVFCKKSKITSFRNSLTLSSLPLSTHM